MQKILVVDDAEPVRITLTEILTSLGYTVLQAADGAKGISIAAANPDLKLIFSDYNMPVMDGIRMISQIKKIVGLSKIPIVMLTTEATPEMKQAGREVGVLAWMVKPFSEGSIRAATSRIIK